MHILLINSMVVTSPEYGGGRVVSHVQTDSEAALEELDTEVLAVPCVEQDAVLLVGLDKEGEVEGGEGVERVHHDVGGGGHQLH